jgi:hypothetical protein
LFAKLFVIFRLFLEDGIVVGPQLLESNSDNNYLMETDASS